MIDLVLVRFLRDHTPYQAGVTAAFSPAVAESYKRNRVVEIIGPLSEATRDEPVEDKEPKTTRTGLKGK